MEVRLESPAVRRWPTLRRAAFHRVDAQDQLVAESDQLEVVIASLKPSNVAAETARGAIFFVWTQMQVCTKYSTLPRVKEVHWLGDSLDVVRKFPKSARVPIGDALNALQQGERPVDTKALRSVASGVAEIRVHDEANNQFRVIYIAKVADVVHVLHAFQKKTKKTRKTDLNLAADRLKELRRMLRESNKR